MPTIQSFRKLTAISLHTRRRMKCSQKMGMIARGGADTRASRLLDDKPMNRGLWASGGYDKHGALLKNVRE